MRNDAKCPIVHVHGDIYDTCTDRDAPDFRHRAGRCADAVGAITGTVVDASGSGMPGAVVKLRDERTGIERETVTNDAGGFSFLDLQASSYQVSIGLTGFQTAVFHGVVVESGRTTDLPVSLTLGQLTETADVTGATPTLQMTSNAVGTIVGTPRKSSSVFG